MSESREDIIEIKDCDSETFQRILFYWELLIIFFNRIFEIFVYKKS